MSESLLPSYIGHRETIPESPAEYSEASYKIIKDMLYEVITGVHLTESDFRNARILIKPNLVRPNLQLQPTVSTDPRVVLALCELLKDFGAYVTVGENPGYNFSARAAFRAGGIYWQLKHMEVELALFDEEEQVKLENPRGTLLRWVYVAKSVAEIEHLINVPKLKTHMHTLVSLGFKNLQGILLDSQRRLFHREDINRKIVDTALAVNPWLTIIDGLWAMEGQAPFFGNSISDFNTLIAGQDMLHVDVVATHLMGIFPEEVTHLRIAQETGYGNLSLTRQPVIGNAVEELKRAFRRPIITNSGAFEGIHVIEGGACSGCLSSLRHSLDKLQFENKLDLARECTVFLGRPMPNNATLRCWKGALWLLGNCAVDLVFSHPQRRLLPRIIPGCPPHVLDFYTTITTQAEQ